MASKPFNVIQDFQSLLKMMISKEASDLFLTAGLPASFKINGAISPISDAPLNADQVRKLAMSLMNDQQQHEFENTLEIICSL